MFFFALFTAMCITVPHLLMLVYGSNQNLVDKATPLVRLNPNYRLHIAAEEAAILDAFCAPYFC